MMEKRVGGPGVASTRTAEDKSAGQQLYTHHPSTRDRSPHHNLSRLRCRCGGTVTCWASFGDSRARCRACGLTATRADFQREGRAA